MRTYFIQFEKDDDSISEMLSMLKDKGQIHQVLDSLYCFRTEVHISTVDLRDAILECSENSRIIVFEIPGDINAAWHLTRENSDWLKTFL